MIAALKKGNHQVKQESQKECQKIKKECQKQNVKKWIAQTLVDTSKGIPSP